VDEYLDIMRERAAAGQVSPQAGVAKSESGASESCLQESSTSARPLSNKELHQARKDLAGVERRLATAEKNLERAKDAQLQVDPTDYEALVAAQAAVDEAQERKDELEMQWLELADLLEG
jgi:hypothetical protein